ncbi:MAG: hypothetical protein PHE36_07785 [Novosphingobium sp.]|nr:hypothetical protein [Novosphingobium sp.]
MRVERIVSVPRTRRSAAERLRDALATLAEGQAQMLGHKETPWASITFAGTRHRLAMVFEGPAAIAAGERFIDALPDHEFAIPRQLVADANVLAVDHRLAPDPHMAVTVEILLLEEG